MISRRAGSQANLDIQKDLSDLPRAVTGDTYNRAEHTEGFERLEITIRKSSIPADSQPSFLARTECGTPPGKTVCSASLLSFPGPCRTLSQIVRD